MATEHWRVHVMGHITRFDHVGITVADLDAATAFFVGLGLEVEGTGSVEGEFVETVCGIPAFPMRIFMKQVATLQRLARKKDGG